MACRCVSHCRQPARRGLGGQACVRQSGWNRAGGRTGKRAS